MKIMKDVIPISLTDIVKLGLLLCCTALLILFIYLPDSLLFYLFGIGFAIFLFGFFLIYPRINFYIFLLIMFITPVVLNFLPGVQGLIIGELPLLILYLSCILRCCKHGTTKIDNIKLNQQEIMILILFGIMLVQAIRQDPLSVGILGFKSIMYYSPIYFIVLTLFHTKERIKEFMRILSYTGFILAIIAILQYFFAQRIMSILGFEMGDVAYRTIMGHLKVSSTLGNASAFATINAVIFIILFFQVFLNGHPGNRISIGIILAIIGLSIVLSYSRITWLALVFIFIISSFLYNKKKMARVFVLAMLCLVVLNYFFDNFIYENFISSFGLGENYLSIKSTHERIGIIARGLSLFAEKAWFGFGLGVTGAPSEHYAYLLKNGSFVTDNYYLKLLIETGIVGTFCFLSFLLFSILRSKKVYNIITDVFLKNLSLSLTLALIIFAITSLAASTLELPAVNCFFWIILGLISACALAEKNKITT